MTIIDLYFDQLYVGDEFSNETIPGWFGKDVVGIVLRKAIFTVFHEFQIIFEVCQSGQFVHIIYEEALEHGSWLTFDLCMTRAVEGHDFWTVGVARHDIGVSLVEIRDNCVDSLKRNIFYLTT